MIKNIWNKITNSKVVIFVKRNIRNIINITGFITMVWVLILDRATSLNDAIENIKYDIGDLTLDNLISYLLLVAYICYSFFTNDTAKGKWTKIPFNWMNKLIKKATGKNVDFEKVLNVDIDYDGTVGDDDEINNS